MSIPFVDREPEKQEIEHLRQLLGGYPQVNSISELFNPNRKKEIIAEAFGISSNKLYDSDLKYKIEITPPLFSENGFPVKMVKYPYPAYWEYLSEFNVNIGNYRVNPDLVGVASVDLLYKSDSNLDLSKSSFLYLDIGHNRGQLSQYSYFVDPQKLRWFFDEEPYGYGDEYGDFDFLCGYDIDLVFRIIINRREILRYSNEKKGLKNNSKRKRASQLIPIAYFVSQHRRVWRSEIFQIDFRTKAAAKKQKEMALAQLEEYIRTDPEEKELQKLLTENPWMFGHEYSEFLDKRELVIDSQQDFVGRRATDGFWDIVEIKRSLNGQNLFKEDKSHNNTLYPGVDLSKAIGQVIHYIDRIDHRHDSILIDRQIDMNKVRVKLIIGRDGDDRQVSALHNLNSHLN